MRENILGTNLIKLRTDRGLTQEDIASVLEISNKTLSKWENGSSSPDLDMLVKLAEFFEVTTDYLLGLSNSRKKSFDDVLREEYAEISGEECAKKVYAMQYKNIVNIFGKMHQIEEATPVIPSKLWNFGVERSRISIGSFFDLVINSDDVNMSVMLLGNKNQFAWLDDDGQRGKIGELFTILSDDDTLKICRLIHTKDFPTRFTSDFVALKIGTTAEKSETILEKLCAVKLCRKEHAYLKDGERDIYESYGDGKILSLITLAYEHMCGHEGYNYSYGGRCRMITADSAERKE